MNAPAIKRIAIGACAVVCALLLARVIVLLMAARPDNAGITLLLAMTEPLVWPLQWLDATQPRFGARFERGTLIEVALVGLGLRVLAHKNETRAE